MTEKASLEGCWFTLSKHVGRVLRQIRELLFSENAEVLWRRSIASGVDDALLPRKVSKLQVSIDRTLNGHTWVRREA